MTTGNKNKPEEEKQTSNVVEVSSRGREQGFRGSEVERRESKMWGGEESEETGAGGYVEEV